MILLAVSLTPFVPFSMLLAALMILYTALSKMGEELLTLGDELSMLGVEFVTAVGEFVTVGVVGCAGDNARGGECVSRRA